MFSPEKIVQEGNQIHIKYGDDKNLFVEFRTEAVHQPFESEKEGRAIFKDTPFIRILFAGDKTKVVDRPITDEDKFRFPQHWAAYQNGQIQNQSGTPLCEWTLLTKSEIAEYNAMNIFTIEALANIPDTALTWHGARTRVEQAKAFLQNHGAAIAARDNEISLLKKQILELSEKVDNNIEENIVKKRGRPSLKEIGEI